MSKKRLTLSPFAWRGQSSAIADANPTFRHKPPHKRITPISEISMLNKHNSINTVKTLAYDKTHKILKGSI
jgi:hypothetical protein